MTWTCSHGQVYTDYEMEMGMLQSTVDYLMELDWREHNLESDREREAELATAFVLGDSDCPWPWYADIPYIVVEPEVIDAVGLEAITGVGAPCKEGPEADELSDGQWSADEMPEVL